MKTYDHLIKEMNVDSIAILYTQDGNMGNIAFGRDSIRSFLARFKNIQVLSQSSTTESLIIIGNNALQKGKYFQTDVIASKDTVTVKGSYVANWLWVPPTGWHIKKMETTPEK